MKTFIGSIGGKEIYEIKTREEWKKHGKLYDRLNEAIEKTGNRAIPSDDMTGILLEACELSSLMMFSMMEFCAGQVEYKSGHAYGERL